MSNTKFLCYSLIYYSKCIFSTFLAAIDICYLIDNTRDQHTVQHSLKEKLQLARSISQCLLSKGGGRTKVATVIYDNNSAKLGFNFRRVNDIFNDGFQQIMTVQSQRRNNLGMSFFRLLSFAVSFF